MKIAIKLNEVRVHLKVMEEGRGSLGTLKNQRRAMGNIHISHKSHISIKLQSVYKI